MAAAVFYAVLIAAVTVAICAFGVRLLLRLVSAWADRVVLSFFGSPEELLRRLQEQQVPRPHSSPARREYQLAR